jgi:hypothetical protein
MRDIDAYFYEVVKGEGPQETPGLHQQARERRRHGSPSACG